MAHKFVLDNFIKHLRNNYTVDVALSLAWIEYFISRNLNRNGEQVLTMVKCVDCNIYQKLDPMDARSFIIEHFQEGHEVSSYKAIEPEFKSNKSRNKAKLFKQKKKHRGGKILGFFDWEKQNRNSKLDSHQANKPMKLLMESKTQADEWRESHPTENTVITRKRIKDDDIVH